MTTRIDVIIPTMGTRTREIGRAIESVLGQTGVSAIPFVVVNGDRFDPELLAALQRRTDIRLHMVARPGVSNARREGRRQVEAPFFAFLDDDDELLPDAMAVRLGGFSDPSVDVVATNGHRESENGREVLVENFNQDPEDPALALLKNAWLASSGGLFRTESITDDVLADLPDYLEITKLAFRLALTHNVVRLDVPTFVIHEGARDRASLTPSYREEVPKVLAAMEAMTTRPDLTARLRAKRATALHTCSIAARQEGRMIEAWLYHLRSLPVGGGWRYLGYSLRLLAQALWPIRRSPGRHCR